jgi:hypothetical protein
MDTETSADTGKELVRIHNELERDPDFDILPVMPQREQMSVEAECIDWNDLELVHPDDLEPGSVMFRDKYFMRVQPRLKTVLAMRRDGLTDKQIAHNLGITPKNLADYKKIYPAFAKVMSIGQVDSIAQVTNAIYRSALGFEKTITRRKMVKGELVTYEDTFYIQPNFEAQKLIATSKGGWTTKQSVELSGDVNLAFSNLFQEIGKEQQEQRQKELPPPE